MIHSNVTSCDFIDPGSSQVIYTVLENGVLLDTWGCYEYGSSWTIEGDVITMTESCGGMDRYN